MKILHSADWHLGHRFYEQSQFEVQSQFLAWLEKFISKNGVDLLLISGDIFDSSAPSTQSLTLYYNFLISLKKTGCKHIVITGGNHDSPSTLDAPKELLQALSIQVVGKATENVKDHVFELSVNQETVLIAAVPYLRDQDIRRAVAGETFDQINDRYKYALIKHYQMVATHCNSLKKPNTPIIAMGHLFAIGGSTSESEKSIYVGNLGDIGATDFPETFDYVALGHLHRPQIVGKQNHIRYSGSPYVLSFSEVGHDKCMFLLDTKEDQIREIKEIKIPNFRSIYRISGTLAECIEELQVISQKAHELIPWVEVVLDNQSNNSIGASEVREAAEGLHLEVLVVALKSKRQTEGLEKLMANAKNIKSLSPSDVFKMKCDEQEFDLDDNQEIVDAFNEVLQIVYQG